MIAARSHGARRLRVVAATLAVLALALLPARLAAPDRVAAAGPVNLRGQLTDDVGALSASGKSTVTAALATLLDRSGVQLWVWFTDTTGGMTAPDFAAATAEKSSFGGTDLLLVLAMTDRSYGYSRPDGFALSDAELEQLLSNEMEPGLRAGDNAGAIVTLAQSLGDALSGPAPTGAPAPTAAPVATAVPLPGEPPSQGSGGSGLGTGLMVVVVVVVAALVELVLPGPAPLRRGRRHPRRQAGIDGRARRSAGRDERQGPERRGKPPAPRHRRRRPGQRAGARVRRGPVRRDRGGDLPRGDRRSEGGPAGRLRGPPAARRRDARGPAHPAADAHRPGGPLPEGPGAPRRRDGALRGAAGLRARGARCPRRASRDDRRRRGPHLDGRDHDDPPGGVRRRLLAGRRRPISTRRAPGSRRPAPR